LKNFRIEIVPHPNGGHAYPALCWEDSTSSTKVHVMYAEETLQKYHMKELTNLEYVKALRMVRDYIVAGWKQEKLLADQEIVRYEHYTETWTA